MILTTMKTATTMAGERVDSDEDNDKYPNGEDNNEIIFDTTTNMWSDAFLAGRGGDDFDNDGGNNYGRKGGLILTRTPMKTPGGESQCGWMPSW